MANLSPYRSDSSIDSTYTREPLGDLKNQSFADSEDTDMESPMARLRMVKSKRTAETKEITKDTAPRIREIRIPRQEARWIDLKKGHFVPTPSRGSRVDFTPRPEVLSYSTTASPSKLFSESGDAHLLLKNRTGPQPQQKGQESPELEQRTPSRQDDDWLDEDDFDTSHYDTLALRLRSKKKQRNDEYTQEGGYHDPRYRNSYFDPMTPYVLSKYIQIIFNVLLLSTLMYFFWMLVATVRHDVDQKVEEYSGEILAEMAICSKEYIQNNCMPGRRVPALERTCNSWEKCMNRDPAIVGRAKVSAETFAEIINSFINPISYKAMLFLTLIISGAFIITNMGLNYTRDRSENVGTSSKAKRNSTPPKSFPNSTFAAADSPWPSPSPSPSDGPRTPRYNHGKPSAKRSKYYTPRLTMSDKKQHYKYYFSSPKQTKTSSSPLANEYLP